MSVNVVVSKAPVLQPVIECREPGESLAHIVASHQGIYASHTTIQVNGAVVEDWGYVTQDGDTVAIAQIPEALAAGTWIAIASLALSVASYFLFKPDEPDVPDNEKTRRVKGDRNQNKAYEPIPFILGRRKITPAYMANPYYEYVGNDQYYRMLLDVGYGPLKISDIRIGDVPITSFSDVQYEVLDWYENTSIGALQDIWARDVVQNTVNKEVPRRADGWRNSFIPVGRGLTRVTVSYPGGLYWIKGEGDRDELCGACQVQYQGSDGAWYTPATYSRSRPKGVVPYGLFKDRGTLYIGKVYIDQGWNQADNFLWQADPVPSSYIVHDDGQGNVIIKSPEYYPVANIRAYEKTTKLFTKSIQFDQTLAGNPDTENSVPIRARNLSPGNSSRKPWTDSANLVSITRDAILTPGRFNEIIGNPGTEDRRVVIALRIKANDQVSGTLDTLNCTAESVVPSLWSSDWRNWYGQSLKPSRNPAELYRWVLQGPFNKARISNARINLNELNDWRSYCSTEGWETSDLVNYETTFKKVLNNVAQTGRAEFTLQDGRFSVAQMRERIIPVQIFTPKNSSDFQSKRDFPPPSDGIKVEFQNEEQDFELDEWTYYDPSISAGDRVGQTDSLELWGVTKPKLAQKHARFAYLEKRLRRETYELTTDVENLACSRGDLVLVQNDVIDVGLGSGIVRTVGAGSFAIDETIGLVAGQSYGVVVRSVESGTQLNQITATYDGSGEWSTSDGIEFHPGDLASYGDPGRETLECIVTNVKPQSDLGATITLVNAANEIFDFDGGPLPVYETNLTPRPENQPPKKPTVVLGLGSSKYGEPTAIVTIRSNERVAVNVSYYRLQYRIVGEFQENMETGDIIPESERVQIPEDAVWIDAPDVSARIGTAEVPIPINTGNVIYFRAKTAGTGNLMSPWSDEETLTVSEQPAPNVNEFVIDEQINTPKTPDGMFSTLVIRVDEPPSDPYLYALAEYRLPGQDEWLFIARIGWQYPSEAQVQVLANGTQYEIRIRSVSVWGVDNYYGISKIITTTNVLDPEYTDENPYDVLPVPDVRGLELFDQGNDTEFVGRDAKFAWRRASVGDWVALGHEGLRGASSGRLDQYFADYQVEVWAGNTLARTEHVYDPLYIYSFEKNAEDYQRVNREMGAWRDFTISVIERGRNNQVSKNPARISVSNTAPMALMNLSITPGFSVIEIAYKRPVDLDFAGVDIWISDTPGFDPDATEPTATVSDNSYVASRLEDDTDYYVRLRPFDDFGRTQTNTTAEFNVKTKVTVDLSGLGGWAYRIEDVDRAFIENHLAGDAVPSEKIANLTAAKITTGALQATESITVEGIVRAVDDANNPQIQTGIGPIAIDNTAYLLWAFDQTGLKFGIDELGNAYFRGDLEASSFTNNKLTIDEDGNLDSSGTFRFGGSSNYVDYNGSKLTIKTDEFTVDSSGNAKFGGKLDAASGTFKGNLDAAGGTFSGKLQAASGVFGNPNGNRLEYSSGRISVVADNMEIDPYGSMRVSELSIGGYNSNIKISTNNFQTAAQPIIDIGSTSGISSKQGINVLTQSIYPAIRIENSSVYSVNAAEFSGVSFAAVAVAGSSTAAYAFYAGSGDIGPFTGAHDALIRKEAGIVEVGDIVCIEKMINKSGISNTISSVIVSARNQDKSIFGVLSKRSNLNRSIKPAGLDGVAGKDLQRLIETYNLCKVNAVGEGQINVCNQNGDIEVGDFICTSDVPGKGMRYDGQDMRYVVARILEPVTWSDESETTKQIACIYLCG